VGCWACGGELGAGSKSPFEGGKGDVLYEQGAGKSPFEGGSEAGGCSL